MKRIVLAYSGGLDTSVAIPWLSETHHAEIVAVTLDLGQGKELDDVRERAMAVGSDFKIDFEKYTPDERERLIKQMYNQRARPAPAGGLL